jgi:magnesium transporter
MNKTIHKRKIKAGVPPGTLIHIGEEKVEKVSITVIDYNEENLREKEIKNIKDIIPLKEKPTITWVNINGIHNVEIIEKIGDIFNLHPLLLEDIMNTGQRPKMENFEEYIFVVLKMIRYDDREDEVIVEQVSLILGPNYVVSFQEVEGDVFETIRERLRNAKGRIRKKGADYLLYALIDAIVDNYFIILEKFGERIEDIEEELISESKVETLHAIQKIRREMIYLRKSVWPLREVVNSLQREESVMIEKSTDIFLRDVYDHTIQVIDSIESYRDVVSGMLDLYLSSISNKMNEVMKILTIFAAIFIPLTFIAGIYGMNFNFMPELNWRWGYFGVLIFMVFVGVTMLIYFKRKKWM